MDDNNKIASGGGDTSSGGGDGGGSLFCTFQSGDDCDKSFAQRRRSVVHPLRLDEGKKSVYWLNNGPSSSSDAAEGGGGGTSSSSTTTSSSHCCDYYYKTVAPAHMYIHKQKPDETSSSSRNGQQASVEQPLPAPPDPYANIFLLGGFQLVSNAKTIEVYITKAKLSSSGSGCYKVSSKEEYLTTVRGYVVKNSAAPMNTTAASTISGETSAATDNNDDTNNNNNNNNNSNDCLYKVLCVVPGGPRPVVCVHLKLLSLQQPSSSSSSSGTTSMTTTVTMTEQSRIARVYWMKLTARLPPPRPELSKAASAPSLSLSSSPFFMAAATTPTETDHPQVTTVSEATRTAAVMKMEQSIPPVSSSDTTSGPSSSSTTMAAGGSSTALNSLFPSPAPQHQSSSSSSFPVHQQQQIQYHANYNVSKNNNIGISGDDLGAAMAGLNFTIRASEERMTKNFQQLLHPLVVAQQQQLKHAQQQQQQTVVIPVLQQQLKNVKSMMSTQANMLQLQQTLLQQQNRLLIQQAEYMQALHTAQVEMKESLDRHMHMSTMVAGVAPPPAPLAAMPPATSAATPLPPLESGQDDHISATTTTMRNEPEIVPAAPALALAAAVGQSPTPKQNDNPFATVTVDEPITSLAVGSDNQHDKPCAAALENEFSEPEAVVAENSGEHDPGEPEIEAAAAATIGQSYTPKQNDNDNPSTTVAEDESIMSEVVESETPTKQNDKQPCQTAASENASPEPEAVVARDSEQEGVAGDSGQSDATIAMPNEPEIEAATTTVGQSPTPRQDDKSTTVMGDEPNTSMAVESETPTNQNIKTCTAAASEHESEPEAVAGDAQAAPKQDDTTVTYTEAPEAHTSSATTTLVHSENPTQTDNPRVENDRHDDDVDHDYHDTTAAPSNNEPLHGYNMQSLASLVP